MSLFYGRDGKPITRESWVRGISGNNRIAETTLSDGKYVSTVWLGLDHRFSKTGPPLIFETMMFEGKVEGNELDCERYSTEAEAREGHARMVAKWEGK